VGQRNLLIALGSVVAVLAGGLGFILLRDDGDEPPPSTTTAAVTTTTVASRFWPLTGLPAGPDDPIDRPPIAVKVSNSSDARPQIGLDVADLVIEERVEGITRLIGIFQSTASAPVGPIRSARDSDIDLLGALGRPVFVWGGANEGVAARVESANVVSYNVDPDAAEDKFRDDTRTAPDNLFIDSTDAFWAKAGDASPPNPPVLVGTSTASPTAPSTTVPGTTVAPTTTVVGGSPSTTPAAPALPGTPTPAVHVDYGGTQADFVWDATRGGWARLQDGTPHTVASGEVLAPTNVVLLVTPYGSAPSDSSSPIALTTGTGDATVLIGGNAVDATWSRPSPTDPYTLSDDATGQQLVLPAGRTWIGLPATAPTRLDQAQADQLASQIPADG
jgi:hypothetical protein